MRSKLVIILAIVLALISLETPAHAVDKPKVESFTASQTDIDINNKDLKIDFEVIVSHVAGIDNKSTTLVLTNSKNNSLSTSLTRTDSPIDYEKNRVIFKGTIDFPRTLEPGVYTYSLNDGLTSNLSNGIKINTGPVLGPVLRDLKGAESGILVRSSGFLDLDYLTINGPAYGLQTNKSYIDTAKYPSPIEPIWKVGEIFNPSDYFEAAVQDLPISITTATPKICTADVNVMKLNAIGECTFTISTPRTKNYKAKSISQTVSILAGRSEQKLFIDNVSPLKAQNLPFTITLATVYASGTSTVENVFPKSKSPDICEVAGYSLKVISGGNCVLAYQSLGNASFLPSDIYTQTIVIEKTTQTIVLLLPTSAFLEDKSINLNAKSTSTNRIEYSSAPINVCSVSGSVLNLLKAGKCTVTATQPATATLSPVSVDSTITVIGVSKKTINCNKGKTDKKFTGTKPKCPAGYKLKN